MKVNSKRFDNIPGYPGYYVSRFGKVYSRKTRYGLCDYYTPIRISINPRTNRPQVKLNKKNIPVHRLVALAYIPNPDNKPCVCHIDNNRCNNRVDNLYWGTYKENTQQCIHDNRFRPRGRIPKDVNCVIMIREDYMGGVTNSIICKKYGISKTRLHKYVRDLPIRKTGDTAKLTLDEIERLKADYNSGKITSFKELGRKYNIGHTSARKYYNS